MTYAMEKFDVSQGLDKAHVMEIAKSASESFKSETKEEAEADTIICRSKFVVDDVAPDEYVGPPKIKDEPTDELPPVEDAPTVSQSPDLKYPELRFPYEALPEGT